MAQVKTAHCKAWADGRGRKSRLRSMCEVPVPISISICFCPGQPEETGISFPTSLVPQCVHSPYVQSLLPWPVAVDKKNRSAQVH